MKRGLRLAAAAVLPFALSARADPPLADDGPVVRAMRDELARCTEQLRLTDAASPYYIAYNLDDRTDVSVAASFGALTGKQTTRGRFLRAYVRVGDYGLDNTEPGRPDMRLDLERLPMEDDYDAIRHDIWHATDTAYKEAASAYAAKVAARKAENQSADDVGDFSRETPGRTVARRPVAVPDVERAAALVKDLSAVARRFPDIQSADVWLFGSTTRQLFLSSEGTFVDEDISTVTLTANLRTQAPDGMPLDRVLSFAGTSLDRLPGKESLEALLVRAAQDLTSLRTAPEAEDYQGPVLFEAPAAAQLVRDRLAPQFSGTPAWKGAPGGRGLESEFASRVGLKVLAPSLRVEDDPTIDHAQSLPLLGRYSADDEGIAGQKITLVANGVLQTLLMSRAPRKGFEHSNGHARGGLFVPSSRASFSNLVVSADGASSEGDLRKKLLAEAKKAGRSYGLVVRSLNEGAGGDFGGSRSAPRGGPTPPALLLRVTEDGKEEPLRGATFGAITLREFEEIIGVGKEPAVVSRNAGMASSVVSPALLFKRLEIKKPSGPQRKAPLLPRPAL
jgi:predicted Zn-dependent protease